MRLFLYAYSSNVIADKASFVYSTVESSPQNSCTPVFNVLEMRCIAPISFERSDNLKLSSVSRASTSAFSMNLAGFFVDARIF